MGEWNPDFTDPNYNNQVVEPGGGVLQYGQPPDIGGDTGSAGDPDDPSTSGFGGDDWQSGGGWTDDTPGGDSGGTRALLDSIRGASQGAGGALAAIPFGSAIGATIGGVRGYLGSGDAGGDGDTLDPRLLNQGQSKLPTAIPLREPSGASMADQVTAIVQHASQAVGRYVSAATIVKFVLKWGWQLASQAFQLQPAALTQVFVYVKAKPRRRRGPHLYTVLKRIRAGQRYMKMLARYAAKAHVGGGHRRRAAAPRGGFRVMKGGKR